MSRGAPSQPPPRLRLRAIVFDLDGTLIDSFADLAAAINRTRADAGLAPLPQAEVTRHVGQGTEHLVRRTVPGPPEGEAAAHARFLDHYDRHLMEATRPYPGAEAALDRLAGLALGLVTNKPLRQTEAILGALGWRGRFALVLGGDSLPARKPDPLPLLHFLAQVRCDPADAAIVGDGLVDIQAGKAAGMHTVAVSHGNTGRDRLAAASPDRVIDDLPSLLDLIDLSFQ